MTMLTQLMAAERRRELTRLAAECRRPRPTAPPRRWWRRSLAPSPATERGLARRPVES